MYLIAFLSCTAAHLDAQTCNCPGPPAHGAQRCDRGDCGPCMCLPLIEVDPDPVFTTTFTVAPGDSLDWKAIDAALGDGAVQVLFQPGLYPNRLEVLRTEPGPNLLLLDGGNHKAIMPGIQTPYDDVSRDAVTVRGFEITDSADKGVYWRAGSGVVIEDNIIHDNRGSPALSLDYANRSGLPSTSFIVRNNHVFNQRGECIYIGGSEGENQNSHEHIEVINNLVHNCWETFDTRHDGINIKDRIMEVEVRRNVVFETHWGIENASPGLIANNLVFDTQSNGIHLSDSWGQGLSGMELIDNTILGAGEHGVRVGADRLGGDDIHFDGITIEGSKAAGIIWAGDMGVTSSLEQMVLANNDVGLDGWGTVDLSVENCQVHANGQNDDNSVAGATLTCVTGAPQFGDLDRPAGLDGTFFTDDDPWLVEGGAGLP